MLGAVVAAEAVDGRGEALQQRFERQGGDWESLAASLARSHPPSFRLKPSWTRLRLGRSVALVHTSHLPNTGGTYERTPLASTSEPGNRRRLQPLNQQLPATAKWAASLPMEVQPVALLQRFPRIANALARLWQDPIGLQLYMDNLLVDGRGGRRGFPPEIHNELQILRDYREGRYPGVSASP